jgi:leader peptidase (prepilin peptidase)/N-methyltransferase
MITGAPNTAREVGVRLQPDAATVPGTGIDLVAAGAGFGVALFTLAVLGLGSRGVVGAIFLGALAVLAVIDFKTHRIPNRIVLPSAALVLALQLALFPDDALEWVLASLGAAALLLALALVKPGGIGMGDVKLGLLLGAGLGVDVAVAMLIGALALWPFALWVVLHGGLDARNNALPLGPALAFGAAVVVLTSWY